MRLFLARKHNILSAAPGCRNLSCGFKRASRAGISCVFHLTPTMAMSTFLDWRSGNLWQWVTTLR